MINVIENPCLHFLITLFFKLLKLMFNKNKPINVCVMLSSILESQHSLEYSFYFYGTCRTICFASSAANTVLWPCNFYATLFGFFKNSHGAYRNACKMSFAFFAINHGFRLIITWILNPHLLFKNLIVIVCILYSSMFLFCQCLLGGFCI